MFNVLFLFSLNDCLFMRENVFHILLDEPTILQKSTRHVIYDHKLPESEIDKKGKKHYENYLTTFSTIVIRGLLDDFFSRIRIVLSTTVFVVKEPDDACAKVDLKEVRIENHVSLILICVSIVAWP